MLGQVDTKITLALPPTKVAKVTHFSKNCQNFCQRQSETFFPTKTVLQTKISQQYSKSCSNLRIEKSKYF